MKLLNPLVDSSPYYNSLLTQIIQIDSRSPAWWSVERDRFLINETYKNPFLDSAVATVTMKLANLPFHVISRDSGVERYNRLSRVYEDLLHTALMKDQTLEKFIRTYLICDNGAHLYIEGDTPSDEPLRSLPYGLMCLDSTRVQRTGNQEYPIIYHSENNQAYKLHESRVISITQSPSVLREMYGVGYSFVSRALILAQHFLDVYVYEGEVLGSRSAEEMVYATGARSEDLRKAFELADMDSDNAGLRRHGKRVYLGLKESTGKIGKLNLKSLPENYTKRDDIEITLTLLALASGGSPNWFYDSVKSGSTRASASESTKIGESKLELWHINALSSELNYKFLPNSLKVNFGNEDQDNNGVKARIRLNLAQTRIQNINSGVTDIRLERELQLQSGEISQSQFDTLELKDGRTPNGLPIYALYQTNEKTLRDLIYFTEDPMDFTNNVKDKFILDKIDTYWEKAQGIALNANSVLMQNYGKKAVYLLAWTRKQYEKVLGIEPIYEYNSGQDIVDDELNKLPQEPDVLSGINDDSIIDNSAP